MALVQPLNSIWPAIGQDVFLAETATVIGQVSIGARSSLWYNVIVRGDVNRITLGCETNLQDGVIVHATYQQAATTIGDRVSVGHAAIVHGCTLEDECLIGMGAKVLDHAIVHSGCLVAAGALVPPGSELAGGYLYAGVPAKQLRPLKPDEEETIAKTAASYQMYAGWYRGSTEGLPPGLQHEP